MVVMLFSFFFVIVMFLRLSFFRFGRFLRCCIRKLIFWLSGFLVRKSFLSFDICCSEWVRKIVFFLFMFVLYSFSVFRWGILLKCLVSLMILLLSELYDRLSFCNCGCCLSEVLSDMYFWCFILILNNVKLISCGVWWRFLVRYFILLYNGLFDNLSLCKLWVWWRDVVMMVVLFVVMFSFLSCNL